MGILASAKVSVVICGLSMLIGCATGGGVYRDANEEQILGSRWNNTDANKTAEHMVKELLEGGWLTDYTARSGKRPKVIITELENKTSEHIDTEWLTNAVRSQLINSRKVRFLNNKERDTILAELKHQNSKFVDAASAKKIGKQLGADYILSGTLSSIVSQDGDYKTVTYQTDLNLTNIQTSEIEWNGFKKIKKAFMR